MKRKGYWVASNGGVDEKKEYWLFVNE